MSDFLSDLESIKRYAKRRPKKDKKPKNKDKFEELQDEFLEV